MGSGKLLKRAIKKYGLENFVKEILFIFDNEQEMNDKEKELVVISEETYNLCSGGHGGFDYINKNSLNPRIMSAEQARYIRSFRKSFKGSASHLVEAIKKKYPNGVWLGKSHKWESRQKISLANKIKQAGKNNSQYGTCWITNGTENKKIKKEELDKWIELGYARGRTNKTKSFAA